MDEVKTFRRLPLLALVVGLSAIGGPAAASPPRAAPAEPHAPLYQNLYISGQRVTSHVVLRSGEDGRPARIVVADPRANTGTGFWTEKLPPGTAGLRAEGGLRQVAHHGIAGVQATMNGPSELRIKRYRLGSVRELRDTEQNVEAHTTAQLRDAAAVLASWGPQSDPATEQVRQTMMTRLSQWLAPEHVVDPKDPSTLVLQRHALGSGALYRTEFVPEDGTKIEMDGQDIVIKGDGRTHFKMRTFIDRPQLAPIDHLFASGNGGHMGKALRFLSSGEKLLAGSWQYLTYFGRDTMISAALLAPRASSEFMGMAVSSVLDRVSPEGIPAHEEDIGDQATLRNMSRLVDRIRTRGSSVHLTEKDLKALETPIYDYKMIDGEFLLPQLVNAFVDKLDPGSPADAQVMKETFRPDRLAALARVFARIDTLTSRPSNRPGGGPAFVAFNPGESVGDWRDSNEGNGGGRMPLDVSAYLVPSALEAISALAQNPKFPKEALLAQAGADRARVAKLLDPKVLAARREDWRRASKTAFEVKVDGRTAARRITGALAAMPKDEAQAFGSLHLFNAKTTLADAVAPGSTALAGGVRFSGIALDDRERVIPVQSSDSAFDFFYGRPSKEELLDEVRTVFQPYPLGLMTPVGVAAANPAFSNRPQDAELFGRGKYHGGVVWGWQQPMMKQGLEKQLAYFKGDAEVESTVNEALRLLDGAERTVGGVGKKAEAWAWRAEANKIMPVPYGASATDATEANNSQLWTIAGSLGSGTERRRIPAEVKVRPTVH
jgi:hypothetical protein